MSIETVLALGLFALASGCFSPVQDDAIDELGPEVAGVPRGPTHRYGQPCLRCHGGYGPGEPTFELGGTVFATPDADVPVEGAVVRVTDAAGTQVEMTTNCAGNFYLTEGRSPLVFPLRAEVECTLPDGTVRRSVMGTRIQRDGACAGCHEPGPAQPTGPAQVYCVDTMPAQPFEVPADCSGGPQ